MRLHSRLCLLVLAFVTSFSAQAADKLQVKDAWIPEMPPVSRVLAGFAQFVNPTSKPIEIVSLSSPDFNSIEMHLSKEVKGMARMIPQKSLTVQANDKLTLKHGSYHLMMFNPVKRFKAGDVVTINAELANGEKLSFNAVVRNTMGGQEHNTQIRKCGAGKCGSGKCGSGK